MCLDKGMAQTVNAVLPPVGAQCANDLWNIVLPKEVEQANRATHAYDWMEGRCYNCDCRSGGEWSRFACKDTRPDQAIAYETWLAIQLDPSLAEHIAALAEAGVL